MTDAHVIADVALLAKRLSKRRAAFVESKIAEYNGLSVVIREPDKRHLVPLIQGKMAEIIRLLETYLPKKAKG